MTALQVLLVALFTYRATILITRDTIPFGALRDAANRRFTGSLLELLDCAWCMSMWVGAGATVLAIYCWSWFMYVCVAFAASGVTGFLSEHS